MADFRKLFLVLVAGCLLFTSAVSAADYACRAAAVPTLSRAEGLAEPMGDIKMECTGNPPPGGIKVNIRLTMSVNITSNRVLEPGSSSYKNSLSEALLVLDKGADHFRAYPSSGTPLAPALNGTQNLYQAIQMSDTEIEWQDVVLAAPGTNAFAQILLTNVRGNAQMAGAGGAVMAYVNITTPTSLAIENQTLLVSNVRTGMSFSIRDQDNSSGAGSLKSCVGYKTTDGKVGFYLRFTEGINNAFRPQYINWAQNPHWVAGGGYVDESGFRPADSNGPGMSGYLYGASIIGLANSGTRLASRIKGIPAGVTLSVPTSIMGSDGTWFYLLTGTSQDYLTGVSPSTYGTLTPDSSGAVLVIYEAASYSDIAATGAFLNGRLDVPVSIAYSAPGPAATITASGTLAPISTVATASWSAPEPRFVDGASDKTALVINLCRTILLFPYITNAAGWDTGIAISNTSADPLATTGQAGACKLSYYGNTGGSTGPAAQTTPSVPAGGQLLMLLSSGGSVLAKDGGSTACASGNCVAPNFTGYLFAVCDFQFAHGYAFISDLGATKLAQGYLALIVPDRGSSDNNRKAQNAACSSLKGTYYDPNYGGDYSISLGCNDTNTGEQLVQ